MSARRLTGPGDPLNSWIFPSAPTGTMTRLGMFCPVWKFRFEVVVRVAPEGQTVMYPAAVGLTAVTFTMTADTPVAGTPPLPVTCREMEPSAGTGPVAPRLVRVSITRDGGREATAPGMAGFPARRLTGPGYPLNSWIFPSAPTGTRTRLGMFCPVWKFRFEVVVRVAPEGQTVMYPAAVGLTAVTFTMTADTPVAGTTPLPVTCREMEPSAGTGPVAPRLVRVSITRDGGREATAPGMAGFPAMR